MSIRAEVISQIQQIAEEMGITGTLPRLTDDTPLTESGLNSLAIAILVARLEDSLGVDPFSETSENLYPVNLGDFIQFYENAAAQCTVDSGQHK